MSLIYLCNRSYQWYLCLMEIAYYLYQITIKNWGYYIDCAHFLLCTKVYRYVCQSININLVSYCNTDIWTMNCNWLQFGMNICWRIFIDNVCTIRNFTFKILHLLYCERICVVIKHNIYGIRRRITIVYIIHKNIVFWNIYII